MNIFQKIQNLFAETETEVVAILVNIKNGAEVAAHDIDNALSWVAANSPQIAAQIQSVVSIVEQLGATSDPKVAAAVTEANTAVAALDAFAKSYASGAGDAQAVVAGYVAVKQATAAANTAAAAAAATVKPAA